MCTVLYCTDVTRICIETLAMGVSTSPGGRSFDITGTPPGISRLPGRYPVAPRVRYLELDQVLMNFDVVIG